MKTATATAILGWQVYTLANAPLLNEYHIGGGITRVRDNFYPSPEQIIRDTIADHYNRKLGKPSYDRNVTNAVNGNDQAGYVWDYDPAAEFAKSSYPTRPVRR